MSKNNDILNDVEFWLSLSERYFEADTSLEEERALKRFVTSPYAHDDTLDSNAKAVFQDVLATMSLTNASPYCYKSLSLNDGVEENSTLEEKVKTNNKTFLKWIAGVAALFVLAFLLRGAFQTVNSNGYQNVCMAYENGVLITDKEQVFTMMRDSWEDIDFQASSTEVMESQLKEMFDVLK